MNPFLGKIHVVKCTSWKFVLLLPSFSLKPSAHDVALHACTIRMQNLGWIVYGILVGDVVWMAYGQDISALNSFSWWLSLRRWLKTAATLHAKGYLAFQWVMYEAVTEM